MSKAKSKPAKPAKKVEEIARLKKELKAAKLREIAHARILSNVLEQTGVFNSPPLPNGLIPPKSQLTSNPAHDLLTLAIKISDHHANSRITVTASPDGTTSVSIEPVAGMSAAKERETTQAVEEPEKEKPAVETEFWNRQGCSFKAHHIKAPQISQRITNLPEKEVVFKRINEAFEAFKDATGSPDERLSQCITNLPNAENALNQITEDPIERATKLA